MGFFDFLFARKSDPEPEVRAVQPRTVKGRSYMSAVNQAYHGSFGETSGSTMS